MHKLLFSLLTAFCFHTVHAQYEEKDFIRYTVQDGLNDNYITCLQQDEMGYIWAGTDIGLNRFDGAAFRNFYPPVFNLNIISGTIRDIKKMKNGQLGIISRSGFQLLDPSKLVVRNYIIADSTAFKVQLNDIWDAILLPGESLALSTASGFYVFDKPGKLTFRHDAYFLKDIGKQRIFYGRDIFSINSSEYLVYYEEKGLGCYNNEKKIFREINQGENEWKPFSHPATYGERWITKYQLSTDEFIFAYYNQDRIIYYNHRLNKQVVSALPFSPALHLSWESKIVMLSDSVFVINDGTKGFYLFHINRQTGQITGDGKKMLPQHKITCLFVDKDKRIWAGTDEGLFQQKLTQSFITAWQYKPAPGDTLTGGFNCVYRYKNKLYAGRYSLYKGLAILDAETMLVEKQVDFFNGNNSFNEIYSIQMYHRDTLWLGTNGGLLWFDTKTNHYGKLLDEIKYPWAKNFAGILAPAREDGYAWMCSYLGGVAARYHIASRTFTVFTSKTQPALPFDRVKSIAYDTYGDVWIGGHSLARWNNNRQLFDTLITVYGGVNKFNDDILALSADNHGSLWLHNALNGLLEYKIKEKKFISYTINEGLPADVLKSFSNIIDDELWIGSNSNLSKFNVLTKKVVIYNQQDGLPERRPTSRRIYFDAGHDVFYMCADDNLVRFPLHFENKTNSGGNILFEQITIDDNRYIFQPDDKIHLRYNENNLILTFSIIDFEKSNYRFAYKINDAEIWNSLEHQRNINLSSLQPGKYNIQIRVTGKSGNEKIKTVTVFIEPPFWKTTWFVLICCSLLVAAAVYLYRQRIKKIQQKADIDKLLAQTEMKALHAQMNPHFIFNSLNSIREMILSNENKDASHFLSKFAHLIRMTLDQSGESFISLRNTIDYLHRYIEMEQIRNSHFTCSISADEELDQDEIVLPPMLIQPFIENAIWHGPTGPQKNIDIKVRFKKKNGQLVCIIDDNGTGIEQSLQNKTTDINTHKSVGIANIKNRIRLLNEKYNLQSNITIEDKKELNGYAGTGTLVTLQLPIEVSDNE